MFAAQRPASMASCPTGSPWSESLELDRLMMLFCVFLKCH